MKTQTAVKKLLKVIVNCNNCNTDLTISNDSYHSKKCKCENVTLYGTLSDFFVINATKTKTSNIIKIHDTDDFEIVRLHATRGTRGISKGQKKIEYKPLCLLSNAHLERILHLKSPKWHLNLILKEIQFRALNNIFIKDE